MENLEEKIGLKDIIESSRDKLFDKDFIDSISRLGYSLSLSEDKNVATMKNKHAELRLGYNTKEGVFYFSSYHEKGYIGSSTLMNLFRDEKYDIKRDGNKFILKSKYKELRINHLKDGEKVRIVYSLSSRRSVVMKELLKLAKYYSEEKTDSIQENS